MAPAAADRATTTTPTRSPTTTPTPSPGCSSTSTAPARCGSGPRRREVVGLPAAPGSGLAGGDAGDAGTVYVAADLRFPVAGKRQFRYNECMKEEAVSPVAHATIGHFDDGRGLHAAYGLAAEVRAVESGHNARVLPDGSILV